MTTFDPYDMLRPYQREGFNVMTRKKKFLNFDDMGLGKTLTTIASIHKLRKEDKKNRKIIIACPKSATYVWQEELMSWFCEGSLIYEGTRKQRKKLWAKFHAHQYGFLLTTFAMIPEIAENTGKDDIWLGLVMDEIHDSGLFNYRTKTYNAVKKFSRNLEVLFLLTGTPVRKGVIDTYGPLSLVAPERFGHYWKFVNKYCVTLEGPFGKSIERNPRNIPAFRDMLSEYSIRRVKEEVLTELPGKQRQIIYIEPDASQKQIYKDLKEDLLAVYGDKVLLAQNSMTSYLRQRQLLVSPKILDSSLPYGSALQTIGELGDALLEDNKPFVIFTPFREAVPIIREYLSTQLQNTPAMYVIQGGMKASEFAASWKGFQEDKRPKRVLICVIKSGASFHATSASYAFMLGYEWDFTLNIQAEDRLCRMGQKNFVNIYYLMHKNTIDEYVALTLNDKDRAAKLSLGTDKQYADMAQRMNIKWN